jgi:hypothetical protein
MRSYEAARTYFSILGVISWIVIVLGGIVALISVAAVGQISREFGGSSAAGLAGVAPGLVLMFAGFLGLVFVQIGRAGVDTAEYTQQMLKIARDQLEVSRQGLNSGQNQPKSFNSMVGAMEDKPTPGYAQETSQQPPFGTAKRPEPSIEKANTKPALVVRFEGKEILIENDKYNVNGIPFATMQKAEDYIRRYAKKELPSAYEAPKT